MVTPPILQRNDNFWYPPILKTGDKDGRWQTTTDCTQAKAFVCMIPANTPVKKVQMISGMKIICIMLNIRGDDILRM